MSSVVTWKLSRQHFQQVGVTLHTVNMHWLAECCFLIDWWSLYVHRNRRLIGDGSPGWPPRLSHSSWTLQTCIHTLVTKSWISRSKNVNGLIESKMVSTHEMQQSSQWHTLIKNCQYNREIQQSSQWHTLIKKLSVTMKSSHFVICMVTAWQYFQFFFLTHTSAAGSCQTVSNWQLCSWHAHSWSIGLQCLYFPKFPHKT